MNIGYGVMLTWQLVVVLAIACAPAFLIVLRQHVQGIEIKGVKLVLWNVVDTKATGGDGPDLGGQTSAEPSQPDAPQSSRPATPQTLQPDAPEEPTEQGEPQLKMPPMLKNPPQVLLPSQEVVRPPAFGACSPESQKVIRTLWRFQRIHFGLAVSPKRWGFIVRPRRR